jgi:hypothetical protein
MSERLPTLHEAMAAVLQDRRGAMYPDELAAEIASRDLWARPSDGAAPGADQIALRARKYPDRFAFDVERRIELTFGSSEIRPSKTAARAKPRPRPPAASAKRGVWRLTENDVIEACRDLLVSSGYTIVSVATTTQHGPDLIAKSANGRTELRIEAKGATSSKGHSARYGQPFSSGQVLQHVSRALYTAAAALRDTADSSVRSAMAFPDTALHRARVEPLHSTIAQLGLGVFWVSAGRRAELEASWRL